ncbi:MAG: GIY-YIG nuclease family protein [Planctomycetaceae bacterium]
MGIVYVLTNAAMPGLVKIGMTDDNDANSRIGQLYTTGVPFPFELEYACRVDSPVSVEEALHVAFAPQRINSKREFFRIEASQAVAILKLLNKPDATAEIAKQPTSVDEASIAAAAQAKARRPNLDFEEMGIPIGAVLEAVAKPDITVTVVAPKKVKLNDEVVSLSAATQQVLGLEYAVRPSPQWRYQGRLLSDIYEDTYTLVD